MMLAETTFAGLTALQIVLVSLALLIILMNVYSGWQNGIVRQVLRIVAIFAAYLAGLKVGPMLAPMIPLGSITGSPQTAIVSILTGFVTYLLLRFLTNMLFRKTREQESAIMRFIYGVGGATIGLFFSMFFLIATLAGIRLLGTVSDAQFRVAARRHENIPDDARGKLMGQLSKAREAIENGPVAAVVETVDPLPQNLYATLDRVATMTADPDAMNRFMNFPGTRDLIAYPTLRSIADDPEIQLRARKRDYVGLLKDPRLPVLLKDETLRAKLKAFEFMKALDFALKPGPTDPNIPKAVPVIVEPRTY